MKDTKHIRRDFHSVAWVMSQRAGTGGAQGVKHLVFFTHAAYQINGDDEQNRVQVNVSS